MNKIKVVENKIIPNISEDFKIDDNRIIIKKNGNYYIDYIDCTNLIIDIVIDKNICANLFEYSDNNNIVFNKKYILYKNSSLIISKFYFNENTVENVNIYLNEENSNIKYNFSSVGKGLDKYTINIYHNNKKTRSDIYNRTIAKKDSTNVFDINSFVDNGIIDCYINQQTKIVTLGESNNKINPNMFTHENSTTAIHSSVIGNINNDNLFYLMSKGIDYKTSVNLIVKGMIISNINTNMEYREKILKILDNLGGE